MIVCIDQVLTPAQLQEIQHLLATAEFVEGKLTAGTFAQTVKHNQQLPSATTTTQTIQAIVTKAVQANALFQAIARPQVIRPPLINRYDEGMAYGWHMDNAVMDQRQHRTDISLTLFLSEPDTYDGGELVLDTSLGEQEYKLPAGSMVVYPATFLHQVTPVTAGVRFAAVTWVQSLVRDAQQRELLFDLDTVRRSLFAKYGKTDEFDLLSKTHANLLRQWAEV